ncbi:Dynactin [Operophtera brumata]|uniref:Dynactin n=1 Tax=Operophtera brumata TaxID=104452 RepID=A0A0L7LKY9_OPEBR|nr:Dynactin [Operophtera brumata]
MTSRAETEILSDGPQAQEVPVEREQFDNDYFSLVATAKSLVAAGGMTREGSVTNFSDAESGAQRGGRKGPRSPPVVAVGSTPVSSSGTTTTPGTLHILAIQPPRAEIMVVPGFGNPFSLRAASSQPCHRVSLTATLTRRAYKQQNGEDVTTGPPVVTATPPQRALATLLTTGTQHYSTNSVIWLRSSVRRRYPPVLYVAGAVVCHHGEINYGAEPPCYKGWLSTPVCNRERCSKQFCNSQCLTKSVTSLDGMGSSAGMYADATITSSNCPPKLPRILAVTKSLKQNSLLRPHTRPALIHGSWIKAMVMLSFSSTLRRLAVAVRLCWRLHCTML